MKSAGHAQRRSRIFSSTERQRNFYRYRRRACIARRFTCVRWRRARLGCVAAPATLSA
jgi:hypothetical protein